MALRPSDDRRDHHGGGGGYGGRRSRSPEMRPSGAGGGVAGRGGRWDDDDDLDLPRRGAAGAGGGVAALEPVRGGGGGGGRGERRRDDRRGDRDRDRPERERWGRPDEPSPPRGPPPPPAIKPDFGLSGALAEDAKGGAVYKGVVLKWSEPPEARAPSWRWRLFVFKGEAAGGSGRGGGCRVEPPRSLSRVQTASRSVTPSRCTHSRRTCLVATAPSPMCQ